MRGHLPSILIAYFATQHIDFSTELAGSGLSLRVQLHFPAPNEADIET